MTQWTFEYQKDREKIAQLSKDVAEMHRLGDEFFGGPGAYTAFLKRHHELPLEEISASWERISAFWAYCREVHPEWKRGKRP